MLQYYRKILRKRDCQGLEGAVEPFIRNQLQNGIRVEIRGLFAGMYSFTGWPDIRHRQSRKDWVLRNRMMKRKIQNPMLKVPPAVLVQ